MKLGFEETQTPYASGSQSARSWTERWVKDHLYCPNCGNAHMTQFAANRPVADFFCSSCSEQYELKSQKGTFGVKVLDGAFETMCERLASENNPNLVLMNYSLASLSVTNAFVVPKHFFVREIIEERKPLASTARRARLERVQHIAWRNSVVWKDLFCPGRKAPGERDCITAMEKDAISS